LPNENLMKNLAGSVLCVVVMGLSVTTVLPAQQPMRAGIDRPSTETVRLHSAQPLRPLVAARDADTSPWPYVVVGAFLGGVVTVAALAWSVDQNAKDCICSPIMFAPVVAGGAVIGGTGGYLVYRIRR